MTRRRERASLTVPQVRVTKPHVRDQIIQVGIDNGNGQCQHRLRLGEVFVNRRWHRYLTKVRAPHRLRIVEVVALSEARWSVETTLLRVKRLLDLAYLWVGRLNGVTVQVFATFLFYAILIARCDEVADQVAVPLEQIAVELVDRGLYHDLTAIDQGRFGGTAPRYVAQEASGLGSIKRARPRAGPTVTEQIGRARVAPPLPDASLTACEPP